MGHVDWERIRRNSLARWSNGLTEQQNAAGEALREFGSDPERGISSSPSIKTWMPQVLADPTWQSPIPWLPAGFWPYEFQARAFARLSVAKQLPRPTAIAAPEGSGKSDCFLLPILDHCARQQGMSRSGVKAVIVYASRAAAQENAARLGSLCSSVDQFQNLRPALLIDDFGSTPHVGPGHVVDSIDAMGDSPPDLLLTVPEMLERSINTKRHHRLWRETTPVSLRFVVLDDLHFYTDEGIQDLAVLLRRLGASLGMASPTQPLPGAVPVVTAGIKMDVVSGLASPVTSEPAASASSALPPTGPPTGPPTLVPPTGLPAMEPPPMAPPGGPPSSSPSLPSLQPLPDLSSAPTSGPAGPSSGAFSRPPIGSLSPQATPDLPGLDTAEDEETEPNELLDLATFLFGVKFGHDALIVDSTMSPAELCPAVNPTLPLSSFAEVARTGSAAPADLVAAMFGPQATLPADPVAFGELLCTHPLVERLLSASHEQAVTIEEIEPHSAANASQVNQGVQRVASLLGGARRQVGSDLAPLVRVDSQLSLRPLSRVVRLVSHQPEFASYDSVALDYPQAITPPGVKGVTGSTSRHYLPAVACSNCGSSGWLAALLGHDHQVASLPSHISAPLGDQGGNLAVLMTVDAPGGNDDSFKLLHSETLSLKVLDSEVSVLPEQIPVRLVSGATAISARKCPVCDQMGVVDLVGADAKDLTAEVTSRVVSDSAGVQGRVIVLTDSADSAGNQIDALTEDTYVISLRRRLLEMLSQASPQADALAVEASLSLPELAAMLADGHGDDESPSGLAPEDLREDPRLVSLWSDHPSDADLAVLRSRVEFELGREFGQRSTEAASLSSTGAVSVRVEAGSMGDVVDELKVKLGEVADLAVSTEVVSAYLEGLLDKLRMDGAIGTALLRPFVGEGGDPAFVAGSRPAGLPELLGSQRPRFVSTSPSSEFTSATTIHQHTGGPRTWLVDWACSTLGINSVDAPAVNLFALESLTKHRSAVFAVDSFDGHRVYGLFPEAIRISPNRVAASSSNKAGRAAATVRAASTVGVSPVEKVRTEWSFKYGAPIEAPNVLYMSAGHVRSDRDVIDTTVDMAAVDTIIADAAALDELGSIPEVRRVGITSGFGTVVLIEPERSVSRSFSEDEEQDRAKTHSGSSLETTAQLPELPERVRVSEDDYFDYLFDRVTSGGIHFSFEFETLSQMMGLATDLPADHNAPELPPTGPAGGPTASGGTPEPRTVEVGGLMVPEIDFSFIPTEYGAEDKPLFETLDDASKAVSSLTKPGPVDDYLRILAPDHDEEEAERLKKFASGGLGHRLDSLQNAWATATEQPAIDSAGTRVDSLRSVRELHFEPWQDGIESLVRDYAGAFGAAEPDKDELSKEEVSKESAGSTRVEVFRWVIGADLLRIEFREGDKPQLRLILPILDIQGQARVDSFARAFLLGLSLSPGLADLLSADLSVEPRLVETGSDSIGRGELLVTGGQSVLGGLASLAKPDAIRSVLEAARGAMGACSCAKSGLSGCTDYLLGEWDQLTQSNLNRPDGRRGETAVNRLLAIETIDVALGDASKPQTVKTFSEGVPQALARAELARAFELALKVWLDREPDVQGQLRPIGGSAPGGTAGFELSMTFADTELKYRIESVSSTGSVDGGLDPTYRINPVDADWPRFDLFLEPVASGVDTALAAIEAANSSGKLGWLLGWNDVRDFYQAAASAEAADVPDRVIMSADAREIAVEKLASSSSRVRVDSLEQNPFALMLDIMARPVADAWAEAFNAAEVGVKHASDRPDENRDTGVSPETPAVWAVLRGLSSKNG